MATFRVVSNIKRNGKRHAPGSIIELDDEEAAAMPWAIEEVRPEPKAGRQLEPAPAEKKKGK